MINGKYYEKSGAFPITILPEVYSELTKTIGDVDGFHPKWRIHGDNREAFKKILGTQSFCWGGEFKFYVWRVPLPNCELFILTAQGKGTCYEVRINGRKKNAIKEIIWFLESLRERMGHQELQ